MKCGLSSAVVAQCAAERIVRGPMIVPVQTFFPACSFTTSGNVVEAWPPINAYVDVELNAANARDSIFFVIDR